MEPQDLTDAEIIKASLDAPPHFGVIFERHGRVVHRYLAARVGTDTANELLDEVFITAFQGRAKYSSEYPDCRWWLLGIAHNVIRTHNRTLGRRPQYLPEQDFASDNDEDRIVERLDADAMGDNLRIAFGELTPKQQLAFWLHKVEGLSLAEAAERLGMSRSAVANHVWRARIKLTAAMKRLGIWREDADSD